MNALISAKNISVIKSGKNILNDVSIDINKNDFITIIGLPPESTPLPRRQEPALKKGSFIHRDFGIGKVSDLHTR